MKSFLHLTSTAASVLLALGTSVSAQIYTQSFDADTSIATWTGSPSWNATAGNPGGAVILTKSAGVDASSFYVTVPLDLAAESDLTVSFDIISIANVAGVLHFYAELTPFDQYFIKFNNEASINNSTFTKLTFNVADVPASATELTLRFEPVLGAVIGATISVAVDNIVVTGPAVDPEGTWQGYTLVDEFWADSVGQLGWVWVEFDPWLYSAALNTWIFLPEGTSVGEEGAWIFVPPPAPAPAL